MSKHSHYKRDVSQLKTLDVYRLIDLFDVTCPVAQHVIKKALVAGQRGHKDTVRDWQDIQDSAMRKLEMIAEDLESAPMPQDFGQQNTIQPAASMQDDSERMAAIGQNGNDGAVYLNYSCNSCGVAPGDRHKDGCQFYDQDGSAVIRNNQTKVE